MITGKYITVVFSEYILIFLIFEENLFLILNNFKNTYISFRILWLFHYSDFLM